jgi:hypothetical protein
MKPLLVGVWVVALSAAGVLGYMVHELRGGPRVVPHATPIERLPARQNHNPWARWSVTEHRAAHYVLIAHVETEFLAEAVAISQQITEPVRDRYSEVLIYFHRPGRPDPLPPRRVQWSAKAGYVETIYEAPDAED